MNQTGFQNSFPKRNSFLGLSKFEGSNKKELSSGDLNEVMIIFKTSWWTTANS